MRKFVDKRDFLIYNLFQGIEIATIEMSEIIG